MILYQFLLHSKVIQSYVYKHFFLIYFPSQSIQGDWIYAPVLYSRTLGLAILNLRVCIYQTQTLSL